MRIFAEVTWNGRQTTVGLSTTATFSVFAGYFSETLEMRPALLYSDMQSVVGFSVIPKCVTLNDLDWLFRVNFCFRAGLAGSDHATFTVSGADLRWGL